MKTRKKSRKLARRQPDNQRETRSFRKADIGQFEAEEKLAENHFLPDDEWNPPKKSKGADEEL